MIHRVSVPVRRRPLLRAATWPVAVLLVGHGLIHLMGVALQWRLAEVGELRYAEAVPAPGSPAGLAAGAFWLVAAVLFVAAGVLLVRQRSSWGVLALAGAVVSAVVIGLHPAPAITGLVVDALVVVLVVGTWIAARTNR